MNAFKIDVVPIPEYEAAFQRGVDGWWGSDVGFSMGLDPDRVLWLFGDTFVQGVINVHGRVGAAIIRNSIAIQRGRLSDASHSLRFFWQRERGLNHSFFKESSSNDFLWPISSVLVQGKLVVFVLRVIQPEITDPAGFHVIGNALILIENPMDHPDQWHPQTHKLPWKSHEANFGSAVLIVDNWLYVYGFRKKENQPDENRELIIARIHLLQNRNLYDAEEWEFYAGEGGHWSPNFNDMGAVLSGANTEFTVTYLACIDKYVMTGYSWEPRNGITLRFSDTPHGPFSDTRIVYDCPETDWSDRYICYAARAHPELAESNDELIVTYVTNSRNFQDSVEDLRIYFPRFLRITIGTIQLSREI